VGACETQGRANRRKLSSSEFSDSLCVSLSLNPNSTMSTDRLSIDSALISWRVRIKKPDRGVDDPKRITETLHLHFFSKVSLPFFVQVSNYYFNCEQTEY